MQVEHTNPLDVELVVWQDLTISSNKLTRQELKTVLTNITGKHFTRSRKEERTRFPESELDRNLVFKGKFANPAPSVIVILHFEPSAFQWSVSTIFRESGDDMTKEAYNDCMYDFWSDLTNSSSSDQLQIELSPLSGTRPIEHWVGKSGGDRLKRFALSVPKSSPIMHPSDKEKWYSFLKEACPLKGSEPVNYLEIWLYDVAHFPYDVSHKLAIMAEDHNSFVLFDQTH